MTKQSGNVDRSVNLPDRQTSVPQHFLPQPFLWLPDRKPGDAASVWHPLSGCGQLDVRISGDSTVSHCSHYSCGRDHNIFSRHVTEESFDAIDFKPFAGGPLFGFGLAVCGLDLSAVRAIGQVIN